MKKILVSLTLLLFSINIATAQIQDIYALADGSVYLSRIIYDQDGDLYGYLYIFNQGSVDDENIQMEYVFLDKNLNKVSNAKFKTFYYKKCNISFTRASKVGDKIIINKNYNFWARSMENVDIRQNTYFSISLKDNKVSPEFLFHDGQFQEFQYTKRSQIKKGIKKEGYSSYVLGIDYQDFHGFVVVEDAGFYYLINELKAFNENNELIWTYDYNKKATMHKYDLCQIEYLVDSFLIISLSHIYGIYHQDTRLVAINTKTGKEIFNYRLEKEKSRRHNYSINKRGDRIYVVGNYSDKNLSSRAYNVDKNLGLFKITLDLKGNELDKSYYKWPSEIIDQKINQFGQFAKGNFTLKTKGLWVFNDGSISWLTEKRRLKQRSTRSYSDDFVLFHWDSAFKDPAISIIEKTKSNLGENGNDFLFSDYIKDRNAVVFFHKNDVTEKRSKDKKWILGINKIEDGKHTLEEIPMLAKDKFFIEPIPAKEGYVLLREYNQDEKYNQIRLERLNY